MNLKALLYGGIALLIVGLFTFSLLLRAELKAANLSLENATSENTRLVEENKDLSAASNRKAGAAAAYSAMSTYIDTLTKGSLGIIKGYKARNTDNEKCLDLTPPAALVEQLSNPSTSSYKSN